MLKMHMAFVGGKIRSRKGITQ